LSCGPLRGPRSARRLPPAPALRAGRVESRRLRLTR
jgi:hypothetical protein